MTDPIREQLSALLDGYCREAGRDPSGVERSIQFLPDAMQGDDAAALVARAREFVAAGATHLIWNCPVPYSAAGARWLWEEVVAPLRGKRRVEQSFHDSATAGRHAVCAQHAFE